MTFQFLFFFHLNTLNAELNIIAPTKKVFFSSQNHSHFFNDPITECNSSYIQSPVYPILLAKFVKNINVLK